MKSNNFVILCLRLMGIYFSVLGLSALPNMTSIFLESSNSPKYFLISPLFLVVSGVFLVILAPKLSRFIIEFSEAEEAGVQITASERTTRIALLVLGIFILAQSLPQFIQISIDVALYYSNTNEIPEHLRYVQQRWAYLIGPVVKLIISAILIIGPDKIIGVISRYDHTLKRIESSNQTDEPDVRS
jgi:hypothetical protein